LIIIMEIYLNSHNLWVGRLIAFLLLLTAPFGLVQAQWTLTGNNLYPTNTANLVGIGTTAPLSNLHVVGGFLVSGTNGNTPISGAGTRCMFVPSKGAFRAGTVTGSQWDDANLGTGSIALGTDTKASAAYTTALGRGSSATAVDAIAFGNGANTAGATAIAIGTISNSSGLGSVAIGNLATASGQFSNVVGSLALASGSNSTALGSFTRAEGANSVAIGVYTAADSANTVTIGNGLNMGQMLMNRIPASIMLGTNSNLPTLFIGKANGVGTTGAVAIGTTFIPGGYKLAVNGKVIAEEVRVELRANWPDYVFGSNYQPMPLEAIESYIAENCHLPRFPSATEVSTEGISLGEMNVLLTEKIEELTLHLIAQNKRLQALEAEHAQLQAR
jgi:hypothetical protein